MRFTVIWLPGVESELARIWLAAPDRANITAAAHRLERRLRAHPEQGQPFDIVRLLLVVQLLAVLYRVIADDCQVIVSEVLRLENNGSRDKDSTC